MTLPALGASAPAVFSFDSTFSLRVVTIDGEPWFVLRDLLSAMGTRTTTTAVVESIKQGLGEGFVVDIPLQTAGGAQTLAAVSEGAATYILSRSNTDNGRRINRLIHVEILPAIRKTGRYQVDATPVPDYERCTNRQQQELATAMSRAFGLSIFGQEGTQHGFNRLRLEHRLHNIADLPAADFERAMATVGELATMNMAFAVWFGEIRKLYLADYVEAGGPWTLWLKREWKKQMGTALPPRPDWLEVQKKLGLCAG